MPSNSNSSISSLAHRYNEVHRGNYAKALELYEAACSDKVRESNHLTLCKAGIARTALRTGDLRKYSIVSGSKK